MTGIFTALVAFIIVFIVGRLYEAAVEKKGDGNE